jgi:phosphogluconate dehydratase
LAKTSTVKRVPVSEGKRTTTKVVTPTADKPFQPNGGVKMLDRQHRQGGDQDLGGEAGTPCGRSARTGVFHSQNQLQAAFRKAGSLTGDFVAVVRFQGPKANGMPELHKLTPSLGVLQDRGYQVIALVTDGRMSGASGKVPAAIHVTPEALQGGRTDRQDQGWRHDPARCQPGHA